MILLCKSIFALLAFYIVFSECIELPQIVKKNKNLVYLLIGGFYLYSHQNDKIEGLGISSPEYLRWIFLILTIALFCVCVKFLFAMRPQTEGYFWINLVGVLCVMGLMAMITITGLEFGNYSSSKNHMKL